MTTEVAKYALYKEKKLTEARAFLASLGAEDKRCDKLIADETWVRSLSVQDTWAASQLLTVANAEDNNNSLEDREDECPVDIVAHNELEGEGGASVSRMRGNHASMEERRACAQPAPPAGLQHAGKRKDRKGASRPQPANQHPGPKDRAGAGQDQKQAAHAVGPKQPGSGAAQVADSTELDPAAPQEVPVELSRGDEALQEYKDMQAATAAELEAKRKSIPKQNTTYTLDTQMHQAEFMVSQGMHLPDQDAFPFSKLMADDDWHFAPVLPQRTKGLCRPPTDMGDEDLGEDGKAAEPASLESTESPTSLPLPLPELKIRLSAPSAVCEPGPNSPTRRRAQKDRMRPILQQTSSNENTLWQAFSQAPAGMKALQEGAAASFPSGRVPPLVPRASISDTGAPNKPGPHPTSQNSLQPLLYTSPPAPTPKPMFDRSSVDSCLDAKCQQQEPSSAPDGLASVFETQKQRSVKLPPLLQKGEPVHRKKAGTTQAQKPLHIKGWVQLGGGLNHRLLSGRKIEWPDQPQTE